ncbi:hypothetical protein IFM47457_04255 [Aspergillus lentulus]|nr:hypothetical protein IFM47457_04255 [Aspergillus lentulus]
MSGAELGLAVVGTVDLCFKCVAGSTALRVRALMRSPGALSFAGRWKPISLQLQFLRESWSSLDEEHQHLQGEILQLLVQKLQHAVLQISKVETRHNKTGSGRLSRLKQWKYAFTQAIFDPSWYLIIRVASSLIDVELARPRQPSETALSVANRLRQALTTKLQPNERIFLPDSRIPFSEARILHRVGSSSSFSLIVDHAECHPDANLSVVTQDVGALARQLHHTEPIKFCLLECFGVVKNQDENTGRVDSFDFIFRIPRNMRQPRSLRDHLCAGASYLLSDVFAIAKPLALSVSYVLITLAIDVLRQRIKNKFAQMVVNCLTCMDESNRDFGDKEDIQDEDGVMIGVKYI